MKWLHDPTGIQSPMDGIPGLANYVGSPRSSPALLLSCLGSGTVACPPNFGPNALDFDNTSKRDTQDVPALSIPPHPLCGITSGQSDRAEPPNHRQGTLQLGCKPRWFLVVGSAPWRLLDFTASQANAERCLPGGELWRNGGKQPTVRKHNNMVLRGDS